MHCLPCHQNRRSLQIHCRCQQRQRRRRHARQALVSVYGLQKSRVLQCMYTMQV